MGSQTFKEFWFFGQYVVFFGFWEFLGLGVGSKDMSFNIPDLKMTEVVLWA